jgi:D-sedoheptulose 7-phosphate isomerase
MVNDCVGHMYADRAPIPAISVADNPSVLTAVANDYGYARIFERQVTALAQPDDALIAISTSGNSDNVLRAVEIARDRGVLVVGLTSRDGGKLRDVSDHWLPAETDDLVCAEQVHLYLLHTLTEALEAVLHPDEPGWGNTVGVRQR